MTKTRQRKMIEEGVALFLSKGGTISKCKSRHKPRFQKKQESNIVEIEIQHLPKALQKRFFPDEV